MAQVGGASQRSNSAAIGGEPELDVLRLERHQASAHHVQAALTGLGIVKREKP
jgi:hypothetical protein